MPSNSALPSALLLMAVASLLVGPSPAQETPKTDLQVYAPSPRVIDGLNAVPIDIRSVSARVHFDVETQQAAVVAEMTFAVIGQKGMPIFDLRQDISKASLDGEDLAVEKLAAHDFGDSSGTMRVIEHPLEPGKRHVLRLEYPLGKPQSPSAQDIGWGAGTLEWDLYFTDLQPGRYLEMWFPANLIYDQFALELDVEVKGLTEPHHLVTNAAVREQGAHHWQLAFPDTMTAFSPMVVILPESAAERSSTQVKVGDRTISIDVCKRIAARASIDSVHQQVAKALKDFTKLSGPWPHGDRCTVFVWTGSRSMEYDGATTTSMGALRHELFHSWFGRGVKPASQNDAWFDEAWDVYAADGARTDRKYLEAVAPPVTLSSANPWNRITPRGSYSYGAMFFGRLALLIGEEELKQMMAAYSQQQAHTITSTADLAIYLADKSGKPKQVVQLFDRYVYGHDKNEGKR